MLLRESKTILRTYKSKMQRAEATGARAVQQSLREVRKIDLLIVGKGSTFDAKFFRKPLPLAESIFSTVILVLEDIRDDSWVWDLSK